MHINVHSPLSYYTMTYIINYNNVCMYVTAIAECVPLYVHTRMCNVLRNIRIYILIFTNSIKHWYVYLQR